MASQPRNVEDIFEDFSGRRIGLIRALTQDVDKFFKLCDPKAKKNLCLLGLPNESWEVTEPEEFVPADIREPVIGINFVRDEMNRKKWLSMVARHSDSWLLSLAFYYGALLNHSERKSLFSMINKLPTVFETVICKMPNKGSGSGSGSGSKSRGKTKRSSDRKAKSNPKFADEDEGEQTKKEDEDEIICGSCSGNDNRDEFWICCDTCDGWFHGKCVKIDCAKAKRIKKYKCQSCSIKMTQWNM